MIALVQQSHQVPLTSAPTPSETACDVCECGRGRVIGRLTYTDSRMWFSPLGTRNGDSTEHAADLRCVDCVAETAAELANGQILERLRAEGAEVRAERAAAQRRSQISVADQPRQTSPIEGDQMT